MLGVIATDRAAAAVRVTIDISADDGHGLGSRYAEALFQEALRLRQAASDEGLAAARLGLLRRHGGEVARLLGDKDSILEAIARIEDEDTLLALVELITLMAIYDGAVLPEERDWLVCVAEKACVPVDLEQIEQRAKEYEVIVRESVLSKTTGAVAVVTMRAKGKLKNLFEKTGVSPRVAVRNPPPA